VKKEAFWSSFDKMDSTMALLAKIPGLSQNDCLPWRGREPAAEAKKAGSASGDTLRMPRPPSRIGSPDWIHLLSGREQFVILHTADLSILSNWSRASYSTEGEHLNFSKDVERGEH
jgi:hypothetical protein